MNIEALTNPEIKILGVGGYVRMLVCNVSQMEQLIGACSSGDFSRAEQIVDHLILDGEAKPAGVRFTVTEYLKKISEYIQAHYETLMTPLPSDIAPKKDMPENMLPCHASDIRIVCDHTGLNWYQVRSMNYLLYKFLLAEAIKFNLGSSKDGREMLNEAYYEIKPFDKEDFFKDGDVIRL